MAETNELKKTYRSFITKIVKRCKNGEKRLVELELDFYQNNEVSKLPTIMDKEETIEAYKEALDRYEQELNFLIQ